MKMVPVAGALLAAVAWLAVACGSTTTAPDGGGADAAGDRGAGDGRAQGDGDAGSDADGATSGAVMCVDGGLAGGPVEGFSCDPSTCVATQYCVRVAAGITPFFDLRRGCHALPCACAADRSCACLGALPTNCTCQGEGGALTVTCGLP